MCGILNPADRFVVPTILANYILGADDTGTLTWTPNRPEPSNGTWWAYEFGGRGVSGRYNSSSSGTGAGLTPIAVSGQYQGVGQSSTGTTTSGRTSNTLGPNSGLSAFQYNTNSGLITYDTLLMIPTLSVTAQAFTTWWAFGDTQNTGAQVDGIYIETSQALGANFQFVTSANSVRTVTDTGVAQSAGTWVRHVVRVTNNASASCFFVNDGTPLSSATATQSTNIPSGVGRESTSGNAIIKTAGTTATQLNYLYQLTTRININTLTVPSYSLYPNDLQGGDGVLLPVLLAGQQVDISVAGNPSVEERIPPIESILFFAVDVSNGSDYISNLSGGTVAFTGNNGISGQPPFYALNTGTGTSGLSMRQIAAAGVGTFVLDASSQSFIFEALQEVPTLSATGQEFNIRDGFLSDTGTAPVDGCSILFDALTTADLVCETTQASTTTSTTTSVAPSANGYYYTRVATNDNTSVTYYTTLLGNSWATPVATHSTNIPSGTGQALAPSVGILKISGTTARNMVVEFQTVYQRRS